MKRLIIAAMALLSVVFVLAGCDTQKTTVKFPFGDFTVNSISISTEKAGRTPSSGNKFVSVDLYPAEGTTDMDACSEYFKTQSTMSVSGLEGKFAFIVYDADTAGKNVGAILVYEVNSSIEKVEDCSIAVDGQTYQLDKK